MKKIIIAVVALAVVAACATGAYFAFFNNSDNSKSPELDVVKEDFVEGFGYIEAIIKNPERYKTILGAEYQMDEATAADFFEAPEEWFSFEQIIDIYNVGEFDYTVYGYDVKDNGKNGIYISTNVGAEINIPVGGKATVSFTVLCSDSELSMEEIESLVNNMEISVRYTKTPAEYDDGTVSVEETKLAAVHDPSEK